MSLMMRRNLMAGGEAKILPVEPDVLWLDGILNAGKDLPHSSAINGWADLTGNNGILQPFSGQNLVWTDNALDNVSGIEDSSDRRCVVLNNYKPFSNLPCTVEIVHSQSEETTQDYISWSSNYSSGIALSYFGLTWRCGSLNTVVPNSVYHKNNSYHTVIIPYENGDFDSFRNGLYLGRHNNANGNDWLKSSSAMMYFGSMAYKPNGLKGYIHSFCLHSRALSATEVAENYGAYKKRFGLT